MSGVRIPYAPLKILDFPGFESQVIQVLFKKVFAMWVANFFYNMTECVHNQVVSDTGMSPSENKTAWLNILI
jgi:hypothetical protein